jgi:hypothetical protein
MPQRSATQSRRMVCNIVQTVAHLAVIDRLVDQGLDRDSYDASESYKSSYL